jgi:Rrf2 family transcriptional regulator, nitric oxide-sensitive transcriptional repressor
MISQTAEYALRAAVTLGDARGRPLTTQQIAEAARVPASYLSKVLQEMGRAGLVESQRGLRGGFLLTRALQDLTVLEVINAVDPLRRIERCPLGLPEHRDGLCPLHRRLDEGIAIVEALYGKTTIAELISDRNPKRSLCGVAASSDSAPAQRGRS